MGCCKDTLYRWREADEPGLNYAWWSAGDDRPHLDPLSWAGPAHPQTGFPQPVAAAPDFTGINSNANVNDSNSGAGAARYGIVWGWVWIPADATHWRDLNGNTGELGMVLAGDCGSLIEQPGGNHTANTGGADRTLLDPSPPPTAGGWVFIVMPQSDATAFGGLQLQVSSNGIDGDYVAAKTRPTDPKVECGRACICNGVPEGWQVKPLIEPCKPAYVAPAGEPFEHPPFNVTTCAIVHQDRRLGSGGSTFYDSTDFDAAVLGWTSVQATRAAECDGIATIDGGLPWVRTIVRDSFLQAYVDFQPLLNGVPTGFVETADDLIEHKYRDLAEDNSLDYRSHKQTGFTRCLAVSAGDVVGFQWRIRGRQIQVDGANPYTRLLVYRQKIRVMYLPSPIVTEVTHA